MACHVCSHLAGALLLLLLSASQAARVSRVRGHNAAPERKGVTPVDKVIELLKKLQAQVEADGDREAKEYDKYACFCKEQADEKLYAIEKSTKLIGDLEAEITALDADIASLGDSIGGLTLKIQEFETQISDAVGARKLEHEDYLAKEADINAAISAVERAIAALKDSKEGLSGKVALEASPASSALLQLVNLMKKTGQPGEAYEYVYHSNDIIATLEGLRLSFKDTKERLYQEEFEANSAFEKDTLAKTNQKTFAEKEKLEQEKLEAAKTERKEEAAVEKTEEEKDKSADEDFMRTLQDSCETKAAEWDQRSKTRAGELAAISQAMEALTTGVVPNWAANRNLVGLQKGQEVKRPPAFIQLRGSGHAEGRAARKALDLLEKASKSLGSPILSVAVLRMKVSEDHFVKVRSIIKDIIAKLEAQAAAEANTKSFCDQNMQAAVSARDAKQEEIESLTAEITEKEALKKKTQGEIAVLAGQIADNMKALKEATELRAAEKADNEGVIKQAVAGKDAVQFALDVLKKFYEESGFLQVHGGYVPPDSDREGNTLADLAPKVFEGDYKGRQQSSKSIIGMLEVILADFERTDTTVTQNEATYQLEFESFETAITADTEAKETTKDGKEKEVLALDDELVKLTDNKKDAEEAHEQALSELQVLRKTCVEGEETYEERVAKREKEIEALKEAHDILENWKS